MASSSVSNRFTPDQEKAMNQFFSFYIKTKKMKGNNFNTEPNYSSIWKKFVLDIISGYNMYLQLKALPSTKKVITFLKQLKHEEDLKRFFCAHVLTSSTQIEARLHQFIERMNGEGHYLCLVPSNTSCLVEFHALTPSSLFNKPSSQVDLLLDGTLSDVLIQKKVCHPSYNFSILLPGDKEAFDHIATSVHSAFTKRVANLNRKKKWIVQTTVIASVAIGILVYLRPHPVNQWIDALAKRFTRS